MSRISLKRTAKVLRRARRVRARIFGTAARPRLTVKRSSRFIYAQLIDDEKRMTLASASDLGSEKKGKPVERAAVIGKRLAEQALKLGVDKVVFDRGSYRYHGRVAALADGAREGGLKF